MLEINRTGLWRAPEGRCVIVLMKYRFRTIKQLASVAEIAHFSPTKQSHPFNCWEKSIGGCDQYVRVKRGYSYIQRELINQSKG